MLKEKLKQIKEARQETALRKEATAGRQLIKKRFKDKIMKQDNDRVQAARVKDVVKSRNFKNVKDETNLIESFTSTMDLKVAKNRFNIR